jgi:hypothetical protein
MLVPRVTQSEFLTVDSNRAAGTGSAANQSRAAGQETSVLNIEYFGSALTDRERSFYAPVRVFTGNGDSAGGLRALRNVRISAGYGASVPTPANKRA